MKRKLAEFVDSHINSIMYTTLAATTLVTVVAFAIGHNIVDGQ